MKTSLSRSTTEVNYGRLSNSLTTSRTPCISTERQLCFKRHPADLILPFWNVKSRKMLAWRYEIKHKFVYTQIQPMGECQVAWLTFQFGQWLCLINMGSSVIDWWTYSKNKYICCNLYFYIFMKDMFLLYINFSLKWIFWIICYTQNYLFNTEVYLQRSV